MSDRSLEFKQGMGCVALLLLGLPSAGIGIGVLLSLFSAHQRKHHGDFVSTGFTILFGLLFLVVGLYIIFWRAGVRVDGERRSFEDWDGFLWLRRSECHPFSDFDAMVVRGGKGKKNFSRQGRRHPKGSSCDHDQGSCKGCRTRRSSLAPDRFGDERYQPHGTLSRG